MRFPNNPRAIIQIDRPGFTDGQATVRYDSVVTKRLIKKVEVELVTNQTSEARITFFDPKFRLINAFSDATAKAVVKVYLGYGPDLGEPIFKGLLAQIERGGSDSTFVVFDMAFVMKLEKRAGYKNKKNDLDIIEALVARNGNLQFEGPENPKKLEPNKVMMQDEQTDWDWMMERARDSGLVIFVRQDTVFAKYPATVGKPSLTLKYRKDFQLLSGFDFTYKTPENLDGKPKIVKHRRRGKAGKRVEGESTSSSDGYTEMILKRDQPSPSKSKLSARAQAQKDLEREHAYEGHLETLYPQSGSRLDTRNTLRIARMGKLFSGDYICDTVKYEFGPGRLTMAPDLYRDIKT